MSNTPYVVSSLIQVKGACLHVVVSSAYREKSLLHTFIFSVVTVLRDRNALVLYPVPGTTQVTGNNYLTIFLRQTGMHFYMPYASKGYCILFFQCRT